MSKYMFLNVVFDSSRFTPGVPQGTQVAVCFSHLNYLKLRGFTSAGRVRLSIFPGDARCMAAHCFATPTAYINFKEV
jgi:hypothetical protein